MRKNSENPKYQYQLLKKIGTGSYGKVFKAQTKSDKRQVAIKVIDIKNRNKNDIQQVLNEIRILSSISSEFIIEYYQAFINSSETEFWIVMELMPGGDLQKKVQYAKKQRVRIPEKEIWKYFVQILLGIKDLNQKNIIHRDIKPANIFLSQDFQTCKIGDMNVSKIVKNQFTSTQIGTPYYLPPEIWKNQDYDLKCDIFSLGCLIYELATLKHPFEATSTNELQKKVLKRKTPDLPIFYSQELNLIVKKCLTKNPENRPTAEELFENSLFRKKVQEFGFGKYLNENFQEGEYLEILDTINMPKKLSELNRILPRNNSHKRSNSLGVIENLRDREQKVQENYSHFQSRQNTQQSIHKNQSDIIKKFQQELQNFSKKSSVKKINPIKESLNNKPPARLNFGKKKKPSIDFINKNKNVIKKLSRQSSFNKFQKKSLKNLPNRSKSKQSQKRFNSVKRVSKIPPLKKKQTSIKKKLTPVESFYCSNNEVSQKNDSVRNIYASNKNPPIRSSKNIPPKVPPNYHQKRKKSKSFSRFDSQQTIKTKQKKSKAIKYGEYMKQVALEQRNKLKKKRSRSKKKRSSSANPNLQIQCNQFTQFSITYFFNDFRNSEIS